MLKLSPLLFLSFTACSLDEGRAGDAAVGYVTATMKGDADAAWALATESDRAAMPVDEFRKNVALGRAMLGTAMDAVSFEVLTTEIKGDVAKVTLRSSGLPNGAGGDAEHVLRREADGWRVDNDWAEKKAKAEADAKIADILTRALAAFQDSDTRLALSLAEEGLLLDPTHESLLLIRNNSANDVAEIVAGEWRITRSINEMTDEPVVVARLPASNTIRGYIEQVRPTLMSRCSERKLSLYVFVGMGIDADYGEIYRATGRIRFGTDEARSVRFSISESRDAVFFPSEKVWAASLIDASGKMSIEVPTYREGRQVVTFDLTGANVALDQVLKACGG